MKDSKRSGKIVKDNQKITKDHEFSAEKFLLSHNLKVFLSHNLNFSLFSHTIKNFCVILTRCSVHSFRVSE